MGCSLVKIRLFSWVCWENKDTNKVGTHTMLCPGFCVDCSCGDGGKSTGGQGAAKGEYFG